MANALRVTSKNIQSMTTADLRSALAQGLSISAKQLTYLAMVWRELEYRGEDLSALKSGLAVYLPLIAENRLDPDAVVRFAGQSTLLSKLSELPLSTQRDLLDADAVRVAEIGSDGVPIVRERNIGALSAREVLMVFSGGEVVSPDRQISRMQMSARRPRDGASDGRLSSAVRVESRGGEDVLYVAGKRVKMSRVINALMEHYGRDAVIIPSAGDVHE